VKRIALVFGVVALLLFADGGYLVATHNQLGGDTGTLFGNPHYFLSAGAVVIISGLFVFVASLVMWVVAVRREDSARQPAADPPEGDQPGPSGRTASKA
jgi:hypothetical protein